jgi:N-acetyl-beta-hexosaminidase
VCYGSKFARLSRAAGTTAALASGVALALGLSGPAFGGIIPQPNAIVQQPGWFTFDSRTVIRVPAGDPDARSAAEYLADLLRRCQGHAPAIESGGAAQSAITFRRRAGMGPEAYRLEITTRESSYRPPAAPGSSTAQ